MKISAYLPYSCTVPDSSASVWRPAALEIIPSQDVEAEGARALAREWLRWMEWRSPSMGWNHKDLLTILSHLDWSGDKPFNRFSNYAILCLQIFTFSITQILFSASNHHVRVRWNKPKITDDSDITCILKAGDGHWRNKSEKLLYRNYVIFFDIHFPLDQQ